VNGRRATDDKVFMNRNQFPFYPVNLDIGGKRCLVVGGGTVAERKIKALLLCGGIVQIISPQVGEAIAELAAAGSVEWLKRSYREGDAEGAFLVFAATDDPDTQRRITADAKRCHVLLNSADDAASSDFHVPAKIRRGDFVIAVSTGGGSPALATLLKARLAEEYGEEYGILVELMARLRRQVVNAGSIAEENRTLFKAILDQPVLDCIRQHDWIGLTTLLEGILPSGLDSAMLVDQLVADMKELQNNE
jgi:precorrin-2 dehydrogenase/sirohydrochlorin ferrochelatase